MTNYLINRLPQIKEEELFQHLSFTQNQIVCGFIYSSFFSCDSVVRACKVFIYFLTQFILVLLENRFGVVVKLLVFELF